MASGTAAPGREALSSRLTGTLQLAPMVVWVLDAYLIVWLLLHSLLIRQGLAGHAAAPSFERPLLVLLLVPFVLLPLVAWWAAGLRRVAIEGGDLLVSGGSGAPVAVPLTEVLDVAEWRASDLRTIRVTFAEKTKAGRRVRFLAPTRVRVARGEYHPAMLRLREAVEAAQSRRDVNRFGKRARGV
jgi:hypothetical protein